MSEAVPDIRPKCRREDAEAVLRRLRESGHVAYFAGGCVRDLLLGIEPMDYDVATDAPPARVRQLFPRTQAVGAAFGVILVRQGESVVEVATFRTDGTYEDGRRPSDVKFTTPQEDARRRDFTINGLFLDPIENRVIDYVGGQDDLRAKVVRAIGEPNHRFEEDHLRMLRAVRFAARFGFNIDPPTYEAIRQQAPRLKRISPERIADELRLMLTPPTRRDAFVLLWELHLALEIFRYLPSPRAVPLEPQRSIFLNCAPAEAIDFSLALAASVLCFRRHTAVTADLAMIANNEAVSHTRAMRQALHLSNTEQDQMRQTLAGTGWMLVEKNPSMAALKRIIAGKNFGRVMLLLEAIGRSGLYVEKVQALHGMIDEAKKTDVAPAALLSGDDLIALGLPPGKLFKVVLSQVYDAQLEGRIHTKEQAVEFVRRITE